MSTPWHTKGVPTPWSGVASGKENYTCRADTTSKHAAGTNIVIYDMLPARRINISGRDAILDEAMAKLQALRATL
jgi:hypothetical protein